MSRSADSEARLERLVAQALREQPTLSAPPDLEARVIAEIERRAHLPWWQRRFVAWPQGARLVLAAACAACALVSLSAMSWLAAGLRAALAAPPAASLLVHAKHTGELLLALGRAGGSLLAAVPAEYLYGGVALTAIAYAVLFATAALAYRVLDVGTPHPRSASSR